MAIRKNSKRFYYAELFAKYEKDIKNTWKIIREIISNTKNKRKDLTEKLVINNTTVVEKEEIAENLSKYFTNIGPDLTSKIPNEQAGFEKYLASCITVLNDAPLTNEEVRNVFYSLKTNKSQGYDDISSNNSLVQGIFPEEMKIARITPICKGGDANYSECCKL